MKIAYSRLPARTSRRVPGQTGGVLRPTTMWAGAMCLPDLPLDWEMSGIALVLLLAVVVAVVLAFGLARRALRLARRGRSRSFSRWIEAKQLSKQRERLLRQAIPPNHDSPYYRQLRNRGDRRTSSS